jgi:hypothetical protein
MNPKKSYNQNHLIAYLKILVKKVVLVELSNTVSIPVHDSPINIPDAYPYKTIQEITCIATIK